MDEQRTSQPQETEEPEVEGHMHPIHPDLARDLHDARHRDLMADADRGRQAKSAGNDRDGGILDKIRRFAGRED